MGASVTGISQTTAMGKVLSPKRIKVACTTNTNVQITTDTTIFAKVISVYGYASMSDSSGVGVNNGANVLAGVKYTDDAGSVIYALGDVVYPGQLVQYVAGEGQKYRLSDFYVRGTTGDGVVVRYDVAN